PFAARGLWLAAPLPGRAGARVLRDGFVFADLLPDERFEIRDYDPSRDAPALRTCCVELQEFERRLEPDLPMGEEMADAYLPLLFERCARERGRIFVAERDGRVLGFAAVQAAVPQLEPDEAPEPYALLSDLHAAAPARRGGVARALVARAEAHARSEGARVIRLEVLARNTGARALYAG